MDMLLGCSLMGRGLWCLSTGTLHRRVKSQSPSCTLWTSLHQSALRSRNYKHISSSCMNLMWTGSGGRFFFVFLFFSFFAAQDITQKIVEHLVFSLEESRAKQEDKKTKRATREKDCLTRESERRQKTREIRGEGGEIKRLGTISQLCVDWNGELSLTNVLTA